MILEVSWDGLWTLSFGLSQFHGHGSWLVCEVALVPTMEVGGMNNVNCSVDIKCCRLQKSTTGSRPWEQEREYNVWEAGALQ
jgi:hypothetical protein